MTNLPSSALLQLQTDARAIVTEVERQTGLQSNWSGTVTLGTELTAQGRPAYDGRKDWNCNIVLHQSQLFIPERHSTLVHEALHSVSVGLNVQSYPAYTGYEEGVVEQCTRLLRLVILANVGLLTPLHASSTYRRQVRLLEILRLQTVKTFSDYYLDLLKAPLRDRESIILDWIQAAEPAKSRHQIEQVTIQA